MAITTQSKNRISVFMVIIFIIVTACYFLTFVFKLDGILDLALVLDNTKNYNWLTQDGHYYRYITYSFLHASFLHYFMNMFNFLVIYSVLKSAKIKEKVIIFVYSSSILLSAYCHMYFNQTSPNPTILMGASGGIFGLIGLLTVCYYKAKDYKSLRLTLLVDLPINVVIAVLIPQVSWIAHLTGFLIGFVIGILNIKNKFKLQKKLIN